MQKDYEEYLSLNKFYNKVYEIKLIFMQPYWVAIVANFEFLKDFKDFIGMKFDLDRKVWKIRINYLDFFIPFIIKKYGKNIRFNFNNELKLKYSEYKNYILKLNNLKNIDADENKYKGFFERNLINGKKCQLEKQQIQGAFWLVAVKKGILAFNTGVGKTFTSIEAAHLANSLNKDLNKILIITTAQLKEQWESEIKSQYSKIKIHIAEKNRENTYKSFNDDVNNNNLTCLIINYETVRNDLQLLKKINFNIVIIDEASKVKDTKSKIYKNSKDGKLNTRGKIKEIIKDSEYIWALTATPMETSWTNFYGIFNVIDEDFFCGGITRFKERYMILDNWGNYTIENKANTAELRELLKPYIFFKNQKVNVKKNVEIIKLCLSQKEKDLYKTIFDNEFKKIKENKPMNINDFTRTHKIDSLGSRHIREDINSIEKWEQACKEEAYLQASNKRYQFLDFPQIIFKEEFKEDYESIKMKWLLNNYKKINGKTIIFSPRTETTDRIAKIFSKYKIKFYLLDGSVSKTKRSIALKKFKEDDINFLIATDIFSYGMNMQYCNNMIFFSLDYNPAATKQKAGRIIRKGQKNDCNIIFLSTKDTFEDRIITRLNERTKRADDISSNDDDFLKKIIRNTKTFIDEIYEK